MKRALAIGLLATAALAVSTAPAHAEGLPLTDTADTGSSRVIQCEGGREVVVYDGTGSAAADLGSAAVGLGYVILHDVLTGNTGSGADAAVDGPCDTDEQGGMTRLLTALHTGSQG
ncbi:hypothetical protein H0264_37635 [Nocardia huaxiensis]|uniref:Uncharacterized protein n=1 Tax=Nocardia huaxiensis TaxID=2755382 RepID=A0A7D6V932_9NOCA|nr:hypothetical protein [Nocardia huaxiensis]QLY30752.1 hypothetical protein H0264_37635 [Nocardia huaxiensis]